MRIIALLLQISRLWCPITQSSGDLTSPVSGPYPAREARAVTGRPRGVPLVKDGLRVAVTPGVRGHSESTHCWGTGTVMVKKRGLNQKGDFSATSGKEFL